MAKKTFLILIVFLLSISSFAQESNLGLSGIKNVRDFGGYCIGDKKVKTGLLLRGSDLSKATEEDIRILEDTFKVAMVIDLRTTMELMVAQDVMLNNCTYINLPCLEKTVPSRTAFVKENNSYASDDDYKVAELLLDSIENRKVRQLANTLYPLIIRTRTIQGQYAEAFDSITSLPDNRAVYIHCTNGKDRTGWAATFLLAALGADRETLVDEFMKSQEYCKPYVEYILALAKEHGCNEEQMQILQDLVGVGRKQFEDALDMIDQQYGSLNEYVMKRLGVDEEQLNILREKFLEDI